MGNISGEAHKSVFPRYILQLSDTDEFHSDKGRQALEYAGSLRFDIDIRPGLGTQPLSEISLIDSSIWQAPGKFHTSVRACSGARSC